ncbi:MAG: DNA replication and repair protein RecF, partial [Pseudomonadota bacterium]
VARLSGMTPLLLLDEVAAHLDEIRRAALFDTLEDLGCQAFMTGTDLALFDQLTDRAARFEVNDGTVTKI